jgi:SP family sugar:H+ symporter-like MFS transporter
MRDSLRPDNGDPNHNGTTDAFGKDAELHRDTYSDTASESSDKQAGVKRIEAISKSWTKTSLIIAYVAYAALTRGTCTTIQLTNHTAS